MSFQLVYSQIPELQDSSNCEDNDDQPLYAREDALENKTNVFELITEDLLVFHHIKKFDSNGTLISSWGTKETGSGEFLHAHGIRKDYELFK